MGGTPAPNQSSKLCVSVALCETGALRFTAKIYMFYTFYTVKIHPCITMTDYE